MPWGRTSPCPLLAWGVVRAASRPRTSSTVRLSWGQQSCVEVCLRSRTCELALLTLWRHLSRRDQVRSGVLVSSSAGTKTWRRTSAPSAPILRFCLPAEVLALEGPPAKILLTVYWDPDGRHRGVAPWRLGRA